MSNTLLRGEHKNKNPKKIWTKIYEPCQGKLPLGLALRHHGAVSVFRVTSRLHYHTYGWSPRHHGCLLPAHSGTHHATIPSGINSRIPRLHHCSHNEKAAKSLGRLGLLSYILEHRLSESAANGLTWLIHFWIFFKYKFTFLTDEIPHQALNVSILERSSIQNV